MIEGEMTFSQIKEVVKGLKDTDIVCQSYDLINTKIGTLKTNKAWSVCDTVVELDENGKHVWQTMGGERVYYSVENFRKWAYKF